MKTDRDRIKTILAARTDRFGEFLLNIPALRALKETFPSSRTVAMVDPGLAELAEYVPYIDEIIAWEPREHRFGEKLKLARLLRRKKIDLAVMLNPSRELNIAAFLAGIPIRLGYDRKAGFLLTHRLKDEKYRGMRHEIDYNLELVGRVGARTADTSLALKLNSQAAAGICASLGLDAAKPAIALHPYTSDPIKQWPRENFRALAESLGELGVTVLIVGGKQEAAQALFNPASGKEGIIDITGKTTLIQLAGVLKKCRLLISGDSGPIHLASCVGTPVVAIFRSDLPEKGPARWGPRSPGSVVVAKRSLQEISVADVLSRVKEVIIKK